jgi:glycosyltransferase involved in cell wall biosynthesis
MDRQVLSNSFEESASIIVCCYNSSERLEPTLLALSNLFRPINGRIELIVVDNNSDDATVQLSLAVWERVGAPYPLRVISEPRQGLTHARLAGIREARFQTIILCDDDNWLNEDYIATACSLLRVHEDVAIIGGVSTPVFTSGFRVPCWFERYQGSYAVGGTAVPTRMAITSSCWGAGMVIRRSAFTALLDSGYEFLTSDRSGAKLSSGGDSEICSALKWMGWKICRDDRLTFQHFIPPSRLEVSYLVKMHRGFGGESVMTDVERIHSSPEAAIQNWVRLCWAYAISRSIFNYLRANATRILSRNESLEMRLRVNSQLGRVDMLRSFGRSYQRQIANRLRWMDKNRNKMKSFHEI